METSKFIRSNILYLVWFLLYFILAWLILGASILSFVIVAITYGISVPVALSPLGEKLLRLLENCREPQTAEERRYLMPLFEEAYEYAKEVSPKINKGIKIYIMDAMFVNAFAIGRQTIAVTRGAMSTFTADELKGIIAHELGHMNHGHTKALLLSVVGNFLFSFVVWIFKFILRILQTVSNIVSLFSGIAIFFSVVVFIARWTVNILEFIFITLSEILLALNSRYNEKEADTFVYEMGYGRELISGMYLLQKISMSANVSIFERMKSSHPHIGQRIAYLEWLEDEGYEE
ncbi:MAG: M48 family metalloprotease [Defluviitaleaceae bacterium]|nr:M48 family metalloprotease [Defluviitaleaceae bacterium]